MQTFRLRNAYGIDISRLCDRYMYMFTSQSEEINMYSDIYIYECALNICITSILGRERWERRERILEGKLFSEFLISLSDGVRSC